MHNYYIVDERGPDGLAVRFHPGTYTSQRKAQHTAKLIADEYRRDERYVVHGSQREGYHIYGEDYSYRFVAVRWFGYF
jgi:hypothetical protein